MIHLSWSNVKHKARRAKSNRFYSRCIERFHKDRGTLLDIGCGDGSFISHMQKKGWDIFGIEVNRDLIRYMPEDVKTKVGFLNINSDAVDFKYDSFDVVTLWNVLEHIPDLDRLLDVIKKVLKKDGLLVLQVPNIQSLEARIFKRDWVHLNPPMHMHHFSPESLSSLLCRKNFRIKAIRHFAPIDKSYRGSFENLLKSKLHLAVDAYFFHNIFYKLILDILFIPLMVIGSILKKGTFITMASFNEK